MTKYNVRPLVAREIEFINAHWDEHHPLKELNPNSHYMSNSYGDTIQVHFNDESLFIIITMTGQY